MSKLALFRGKIPVVPPPPTIPASVNAPVQGTDLTSVWLNQVPGAAGPQAPYLRTWSGTLVGDTYLIGKGAVINNVGAIWFNAGTGLVEIENYDFQTNGGSPQVQGYCTGGGIIRFINCNMPIWSLPSDFNGNVYYSDGTGVVELINCKMEVSTFGFGSGYLTFTNPLFKGQVQNIGDPGGNALGNMKTVLLIDGGYSTGGGLNPQTSSHVELMQYRATAVGSTFTINNHFCDLNGEGQALVPPWGVGGAWTAAYSSGGGNNWQVTNSIFIGANAINTANPGRLPAYLAYGNRSDPFNVANCIFEAGSGYTVNGNDPPFSNRPTTSGCRTLANVAINIGDLG